MDASGCLATLGTRSFERASAIQPSVVPFDPQAIGIWFMWTPASPRRSTWRVVAAAIAEAAPNNPRRVGPLTRWSPDALLP